MRQRWKSVKTIGLFREKFPNKQWFDMVAKLTRTYFRVEAYQPIDN